MVRYISLIYDLLFAILKKLIFSKISLQLYCCYRKHWSETRLNISVKYYVQIFRFTFIIGRNFYKQLIYNQIILFSSSTGLKTDKGCRIWWNLGSILIVLDWVSND